jgi:hypothetical protein
MVEYRVVVELGEEVRLSRRCPREAGRFASSLSKLRDTLASNSSKVFSPRKA